MQTMRKIRFGLKRVKGHGSRMTLLASAPLSPVTWHIKLRPTFRSQSLRDEITRLRWSKGIIPVTPRAAYIPGVPIAALITKTIDGKPAHKLIGTVPPKQIIAGLMDAITLLQNTPIADFPFEPPKWAASKHASSTNLANLNNKRKLGKKLHPDFDRLNDRELKKIIKSGTDKAVQGVLSHGDICMPNLLYNDEAKLVGLIDIGALHINNPLLDIALLSWCIKANMGPKWSDYFLKQYNLEENDSQIQYHRLAYDLSLDFPDAWAWVDTPKLVRQRSTMEQEI